ncbi:hypothetical protein B566_EDAN011233 [Ephemera danica]|nr:hypothetical protein B566_EDAN011233 [Ephemera danica]
MTSTSNTCLSVSAVVLWVPESTQAIQCFQCTVKPPKSHTNETRKPCTNFRESKEFIVDCPHSTLCMKHIYWLELANGTVEGVTRDCAPQRYHYREYENEEWKRKMRVDTEAYEEGCIVSEPGSNKPTRSEYCYCSQHLCNAGKATHDATSAAHTDAMAVIFVFNAMKYIRSLR